MVSGEGELSKTDPPASSKRCTKPPLAVTRCNLLQSLLSTLNCREEAAELILNGKRGLSERRGREGRGTSYIVSVKRESGNKIKPLKTIRSD